MAHLAVNEAGKQATGISKWSMQNRRNLGAWFIALPSMGHGSLRLMSL